MNETPKAPENSRANLEATIEEVEARSQISPELHEALDAAKQAIQSGDAHGAQPLVYRQLRIRLRDILDNLASDDTQE